MTAQIASLLTAALFLGTRTYAATAVRAASVAEGFLARAPAFSSLATCSEAYHELEEQCSLNEAGSDFYTGRQLGRQGGLVDDEDGGSTILTKGGKHGRKLYKPPEGETGVPSDITGWDYRAHGDDWDHLGECGNPGQSPIDLARYVDVQGQTKYLLWFDYYLDPYLKASRQAKLINDGHGLRYDVRSNGVDMGLVKIGTEEFEATEYIFHAPSEHSMDGAVFPLELQIYNKAKHTDRNSQGSSGSGIVAVAILFREGDSNPFLASLKESMGGNAPRWTMKEGMGEGTITGNFSDAFDLEAVIPKGNVAKEKTFYNYQGSLTQPPCTGGVDWWVLSMPITATRDEIRFIRRGIYTSASTRHGNARSAMPLGDRTIFAGLTGFQHAFKTHVMPEWQKLNQVKQPRGYSSEDQPWGFHWAPDLAGPAPGPGPAPAMSPAPML